MKRWVHLGVFLGLVSCRPADVNTRTVRERLEAGEVVEYSSPGAMRETCPRHRPPWNRLSLTPEMRQGLVLGNFVSILGAGKQTCFQVGTEITLNQKGFENLQAGRAVITRLSLIRVDLLEKSLLKGKAWASDEIFQREKSNLIHHKLKPQDNGIVHILELQYVKGSAEDEKSLEQGISLLGSGE